MPVKAVTIKTAEEEPPEAEEPEEAPAEEAPAEEPKKSMSEASKLAMWKKESQAWAAAARRAQRVSAEAVRSRDAAQDAQELADNLASAANRKASERQQLLRQARRREEGFRNVH